MGHEKHSFMSSFFKFIVQNVTDNYLIPVRVWLVTRLYFLLYLHTLIIVIAIHHLYSTRFQLLRRFRICIFDYSVVPPENDASSGLLRYICTAE